MQNNNVLYKYNVCQLLQTSISIHYSSLKQHYPNFTNNSLLYIFLKQFSWLSNVSHKIRKVHHYYFILISSFIAIKQNSQNFTCNSFILLYVSL